MFDDGCCHGLSTTRCATHGANGHRHGSVGTEAEEEPCWSVLHEMLPSKDGWRKILAAD